MRFFDEAESETISLGRLGRIDAGVYDEGYATEDAASRREQEYQSEGIPVSDGEDEESASGPVRIFVGRAAVPVAATGLGLGRPDADDLATSEVGVEPNDGPIAAFADDDSNDGESFDDAYDEFDDEPIPTHMRAPPNAPGMRLLTPESDESLNTDRAWPGLLPRSEQPAASSRDETRPSWLGSMPDVRSRADGSADAAVSGRSAQERAWGSPLLDFSDQGESRPAWSLDAEDNEAIEVGDDEGGELPVHQPMSYGDDGYFADEPLEAEGADDEDDEVTTGNWNRLAVLSSGDASEQETTRFGVAPSPVWKAQDPGEEYASGEAEGAFPWSDAPAWATDEDQTTGMDAVDESGPALPPIRAMGSVLQQELNARKAVRPKAVVLKTLDGVSAPPLDLVDEPGELRSRVPAKGRRGAVVEASTGPVAVDSDTGSVRLLLGVAATLLIFFGAVWKWQEFATGPEAVRLENAGAPTAVAVADAPGLVEPKLRTPVPPAAADAGKGLKSSRDEPRDRLPLAPSKPVPAPVPAPPPSAPVPASPAVAEGPSEVERAEAARRASREDRKRALQAGMLFVTTDSAAYVYVDGKRVAKAPMESPGLKLQPGHYDVRVVPRGRGRAYVTNTRVDAGRVRNIRVDFLAKK
jgi:hypothetical protein